MTGHKASFLPLLLLWSPPPPPHPSKRRQKLTPPTKTSRLRHSHSAFQQHAYVTIHTHTAQSATYLNTQQVPHNRLAHHKVVQFNQDIHSDTLQHTCHKIHSRHLATFLFQNVHSIIMSEDCTFRTRAPHVYKLLHWSVSCVQNMVCMQ